MTESEFNAYLSELQTAWNYYAPLSRSRNVNPRNNMISVTGNLADRTVTYVIDGAYRIFTSSLYDFFSIVESMVVQIAQVTSDYSHSSLREPPNGIVEYIDDARYIDVEISPDPDLDPEEVAIIIPDDIACGGRGQPACDDDDIPRDDSRDEFGDLIESAGNNGMLILGLGALALVMFSKK